MSNQCSVYLDLQRKSELCHKEAEKRKTCFDINKVGNVLLLIVGNVLEIRIFLSANLELCAFEMKRYSYNLV